MTGPLASQRHLFDLPDDVAYLNAAYLPPMALPVREAGRRAIDAAANPWGITPREFFEPGERLRSSLAALINGDADAPLATSRWDPGARWSCSRMSSLPTGTRSRRRWRPRAASW
jgi:hypothetical protein